jgi:hypothetical protein
LLYHIKIDLLREQSRQLKMQLEQW